MGDLKFDLAVNIRSTPRAKLALDRVVAALRASSRLRWKGHRVTQEAAFSALLLWLGDLDEQLVEEKMAVYLPRLEAIMRGEDPGPIEVEAAARVAHGHAVDPQSGLKLTQGPRRPGRKGAKGA